MVNWDEMWNDPSFKKEEKSDLDIPESFDLGIPSDSAFSKSAWQGKTAYEESASAISELEEAVNSGKNPKIIEALARKALDQVPDTKDGINIALTGVLVGTLIQTNKCDEADSIARKTLKKDPYNSIMLAYRARCAFLKAVADLDNRKKEYRIEKLNQSIKFMSKALELAPSDSRKNIISSYKQQLGDAFCTLYREVNGAGYFLSDVVSSIFTSADYSHFTRLNDSIEKYGREGTYRMALNVYKKAMGYLKEAFAALKKHECSIGNENKFFDVVKKCPHIMKMLESGQRK